MPWKTQSAKEQRIELVTLARKPGANISELARRFGVSRKTVYKWLKRDDMDDRSRRPKNNTKRVPPQQGAIQSRPQSPIRDNPMIPPYLDMLLDAVRRPQERLLRTMDGLSLAQLNALPVAASAPTIKSIGWLVWHTAREQDLQIAALAGTEALWTRDGWNRRFAFDLPDDTEDWRHTPAEAAQVIIRDAALLRDYLAAATQAVIDYLQQLPPDALPDIIDRRWNPPVSRAVRLISIIDDAAMHSGQAVYVRRLLGLTD
jgi:hypothetical protein avisC_12832